MSILTYQSEKCEALNHLSMAYGKYNFSQQILE